MNRSSVGGGSGPSFDDVVLPHLDAAYRLARWLISNEADAEDVVQDASLRALRYFRTFSGGNGRAWFLRIVRNTCWNWKTQKNRTPTDLFDEEQHIDAQPAPDPEALLLRADHAALVDHTLKDLPERFRELLVLRELEDLSYQEMADVLEIPIGTVMSGLSRARQAFRRQLDVELNRVDPPASARSREPVPSLVNAAPTTDRGLEAVGAGASSSSTSIRQRDNSNRISSIRGGRT